MLPGITNWKTGQQFVGPLTILECIRKLAYRLKIPSIWKIHLVILITDLELATNPANDLYWRPRLDHLGPMEPENNVEPTGDNYVIKKLLGKMTSQGRTHYLVRWLGYCPEHDVWYDIINLDSAKDLVDKYNQDHEARTFTQPRGSCWAQLAQR